MSMMQNVKCVIVGDNSVGKSCLLITFASKTFPEEKTEPDTCTVELKVDVLCEDIKPGVLPIRLLEVLSDSKAGRYQKNPKTKFQQVCMPGRGRVDARARCTMHAAAVPLTASRARGR